MTWITTPSDHLLQCCRRLGLRHTSRGTLIGVMVFTIMWSTGYSPRGPKRGCLGPLASTIRGLEHLLLAHVPRSDDPRSVLESTHGYTAIDPAEPLGIPPILAPCTAIQEEWVVYMEPIRHCITYMGRRVAVAHLHRLARHMQRAALRHTRRPSARQWLAVCHRGILLLRHRCS